MQALASPRPYLATHDRTEAPQNQGERNPSCDRDFAGRGTACPVQGLSYCRRDKGGISIDFFCVCSDRQRVNEHPHKGVREAGRQTPVQGTPPPCWLLLGGHFPGACRAHAERFVSKVSSCSPMLIACSPVLMTCSRRSAGKRGGETWRRTRRGKTHAETAHTTVIAMCPPHIMRPCMFVAEQAR